MPARKSRRLTQDNGARTVQDKQNDRDAEEEEEAGERTKNVDIAATAAGTDRTLFL